MKRFSMILCIILCFSLFFLLGCEKKPDTPAELTFPGLEWGMTKEEVIAALSLQEGDYEIEEASQGGSFSMTIEDQIICFGTPMQGMWLTFCPPDSSPEVYGLSNVNVVYPEGTDMQLVRRYMESYYGLPKDENTKEQRWEQDSGGHVAHWATDETLGDVLTDEIKQAHFVMDGDPMNPEPGKMLNFYLKRPLREIYWSDDRNIFESNGTLEPCGQGYLVFSGGYGLLADYWLAEQAN